MALEWIDGYYIRSSSKEVYEKHEFEWGEPFSANVGATTYTDCLYPFGYYDNGAPYWYFFSHGRHRVTYPPDETVYYFDPISYSSQINDKIGDRYKIQFQNLVIFNDQDESVKYGRGLDYDASKIIRGTPLWTPSTYEWEAVASISGNNETHALAQVNSESINDGEPVSDLVASDFIALPDAIKVKALADARVRE